MTATACVNGETGAAGLASDTDAYPAKAIYTKLDETCSDLSRSDMFFSGIAKNDWLPVSDVSQTPIADLAEFGRKFFANMGGGRFKRDARYFSQEFAGQDLFLEAAVVDYPKIGDRAAKQVLGCRIFDLDEARIVPKATLNSWFEVEPTKEFNTKFLSGVGWKLIDTETTALNVSVIHQTTSDDPNKLGPLVGGMVFAKEQENVIADAVIQ